MINNNKNLSVVIIVLVLIFGTYFLQGEDKKGFSGFEFSIGSAFPGFSDLAFKNEKIMGEANDLLAFYNSLGWKNKWDSISGKLNDFKYMIPLNISTNFNLSSKFIVKAGIELSFGDRGSLLKNKIGDENNDISVDYQTKFKTSYFMPYIGVEYKFANKFSLYSNIGLGMASLNYTEKYDLKNGSDIYYLKNSEYSGSGTGLSLLIGGKINIKKYVFIKIEYFYFKTGFFGDLQWSKDSWKESASSGKISGDFYTNDILHPNSGELTSDWSVFASSSPNIDGVSNLNLMKLDYSTIRIMLGFYWN